MCVCVYVCECLCVCDHDLHYLQKYMYQSAELKELIVVIVVIHIVTN